MGWGLGISGIVIWVAIALRPASVRGRKGQPFFGYSSLSLLFFPLALIMLFLLEIGSVACHCRPSKQLAR